MDHARHLSSPSPTSSFLFQHSDRAFKSNLLDGDDDEPDDMDAMHNMLSASSTSSTTTMTLLNDGHSHNPFARISLEEYSPLSLVDECDNPLAMSPNSLACGPNHPFKTSLSNLDVSVVTDVASHEHDDDIVAGARSLSPTLLSATTNARHHHLWTNSSTAISQNPVLLASSSASFLLSQHSLIQQLEPQSLDCEHSPVPPAPLLPNGLASASLDFDNLAHHHHHHNINININNLLNHRPSSEPPPTAASATKQQQQPSNSSSSTLCSSSSSSSNSTAANCSASSASARRAPDGSARLPAGMSPPTSFVETRDTATHSSKVHLQLNHQQKLKELQLRLFGPAASGVNAAPQKSEPAATTDTSSSSSSVGSSQSNGDNGRRYSSGRQAGAAAPSICTKKSQSSSTSASTSASIKHKPEADSSASAFSTSSSGSGSAAESSASKQASSAKSGSKRVRVRPTPRRRSRANKNGNNNNKTIDNNSATCLPTTKSSGRAQPSSKLVVATETAEPDTTTKSSECIKLADLLASSASIEAKNCNVSMMLNNVLAANGVSSDASGLCEQSNEKRASVQHIQFQVSPSLTVVSSGALMQPISMQTHQQLANNAATTIVCSAALDNQVLCRPITVMTPIGANLNNTSTNNSSSCSNSNTGINGTQIKCNIVTANELVRADGDNTAMLAVANWQQANQLAAAANSNNGASAPSNGKSVATAGQATPMGSHQIAIQVICQDGTSLVLPVSSAATLNGLSLGPQGHQQLQAILTNGAASGAISNQQQARNMLPLVSVANIVAQQQQQQQQQQQSTLGADSNSAGQKGNTAAAGSQTSGLAASSPTLAALLDAGSTRNNGNSSNASDVVNMCAPQRIVSTNLLRKLMASNQANMELKRGGELSLQPGTQLGLTNNCSLVTVCTAAPAANNPLNGPSAAINSNGKTISGGAGGCGGGRDKRLKVENNGLSAELSNGKSGVGGEGGPQTTLTIIEPQGLVVANGNTDAKFAATGADLAQTKAALLGASQPNGVAANKSAMGQSKEPNSNGASSLKFANSQTSTTSERAAANSSSSKQSKMTSSTGNRQVDPTQPFRCEHCNSTFTRLGNFTRHKKIHTVPIKDGQRFKCDVCSKSFLQRCDLARHLHIHRGTEPHRCNICGKGYIRHSDLVTHQRFHNKEKPFGCPHCSKGFCQRGDLNRHLRSIHLQMKPILCPCCNRKFAKQETLLRHLNTAHRSRTGGQQATISLVATAPSSSISINGPVAATTATSINSNTNNSQLVEQGKSVASLEAIQATLCKVQQSAIQQTADPSIAVKVELLPADELVS